jgi:hypothetical protein
MPTTVDIGTVKPIARPNRDPVKPVPGGNPLWSIPLSVLSATQTVRFSLLRGAHRSVPSLRRRWSRRRPRSLRPDRNARCWR